MKYLNLLILAVLLFACSKDDNIHELPKNTDIQINELILSGCKGNKTTSTNNESVIIEPIADDKIKVSHQNAMFNCCIEDSIVEMNINGNDIKINELSTEPICNCICPYDIEFNIENLSPGEYNFSLTYQNLQKVKLTFQIPLKNQLQVDL